MTARVWYLREPETLVVPLGKITRVDVPNGNLFVDAVGEGLSADVDTLEAFVNVVDGRSGLVKGSAQVLWINGNIVQFKSTIDPAYQNLAGKSVTALSAFTETPEIGDYLCNIEGTCVPFMGKPLCNFLIQYAVVEMRKKVGEAIPEDLELLKQAQEALERTWVGREEDLRVKRKTGKWQHRNPYIHR
jgi:hypothetical protein